MTPTVPPRRPRSPGRRSFSPGTDADWEQALKSPHVQAMLRDPSILQAAASQGAQQPQRFAGGGQQSDSSLASLPESVLIRLTTDPELSQPQQAQAQAALQRKRSGIPASSPIGSSGAGGTGGIPGVASADTMGGLKSLETAGAPTVMNTLAPAALAGAAGLSGTYGKANIGAGIAGAGIAALLNYAIRRKGQQKKTGTAAGPQAPGSESLTRAQAAPSGALNSYYEPQGGMSKPRPDSVPSDSTDAPDSTPWSMESAGATPWSMTDATTADPGIGALQNIGTQDLYDTGLGIPNAGGYARGGEVHPDAAEDRKQTLGILKEKKLIKARGGKFADGGELPPPKKGMGKAILLRRPLAHAMPVLHTTIVISAKPKKGAAKKKRRGGSMKASALPPKKGPENDGPPAPYKKGGHVQVPRGTGAAIRGKRFGGIY